MGNTPIHLASAGGHISCIRVLAQHGADVNASTPIRDNKGGGTALHQACESGRADVVKALLMLGADVTQAAQNGRTPLIIAADCGHESVVDVILETATAEAETLIEVEGKEGQEGALGSVDINVVTVAGKTALYLACEGGHVGIADKLIRAGADVSKPTSRRKIPLYVSAEQCVLGRVASCCVGQKRVKPSRDETRHDETRRDETRRDET